MSRNWVTKNGRTSKRGLFVEGIWHCDCETRLPAEKFQVKNGGKNHGRWFYTCQRPQPKRCSFFLWSDDAKIREEAAVLSNHRSEPVIEDRIQLGEGGRLRSEMEPPKTPKRQIKITQPITPTSKHRDSSRDPYSPTQPRQVEPNRNDESFDWSSSQDEELADFAESLEAGTSNLDVGLPRKSLKTSLQDSPRKRNHETGPPASEITSGGTWPVNHDNDVFMTPSTSTKPETRSGLLSPGITPARLQEPSIPRLDPLSHVPPYDRANYEEPCALALDALSIISTVRPSLSPTTEQKLVSLLNKYDLRTQGISRGRDMARLAVQNKDRRITELQQRIRSLESERETNRAVIQHLKIDMLNASSPGKSRQSHDAGTRRSEV